jgi:hypothetical protein
VNDDVGLVDLFFDALCLKDGASDPLDGLVFGVVMSGSRSSTSQRDTC